MDHSYRGLTLPVVSVLFLRLSDVFVYLQADRLYPVWSIVCHQLSLRLIRNLKEVCLQFPLGEHQLRDDRSDPERSHCLDCRCRIGSLCLGCMGDTLRLDWTTR